MRIRYIIVGSLVALVLAISLGATFVYLAPNLVRSPSENRPDSLCCTTSFPGSSSSSGSASGCTVTAESPLVVYVMDSTDNSPISSLPVQVSERELQPTSCSYGSPFSVGTLSTDGNGSVSVCCTGDEFRFNFTYAGESYSLGETASGAEAAECVTFYVPSSNTTTEYSQPFGTDCPALQSSFSSSINASNPCSGFFAYSSRGSDAAFSQLLSNVQNYTGFIQLEGNRTGYHFGGGGCGTAGLSISFHYTDLAHPFRVCGNATAWPTYNIAVQVGLTQTGYNLANSTFTATYSGPTNTTVLCTTTTG